MSFVPGAAAPASSQETAASGPCNYVRCPPGEILGNLHVDESNLVRRSRWKLTFDWAPSEMTPADLAKRFGVSVNVA
jgi:hypothetical protein